MMSPYTKYFPARRITVSNGVWSESVNPTAVRQTLSDISTKTGKKDVRVQNYHSYRKIDYSTVPFLSGSFGYFGGKPIYQIVYNNSATTQFSVNSTPLRGNLESWRALQFSTFSRMLDKARGSTLNLAVDAFEHAATFKMLKAAVSFKKLAAEFVKDVLSSKKYRRIRGKSKRSQERRTKYIAGKWLEYRYGWQPFLGTVYELADQLRTKRVAGVTRFTCRSSHQTRNVRKYSGVDQGEILTEVGTYQYQLVYWFDISSDKTISDFTSLNPLGIAWELVPFSFVVDWLIDIGKYLETWENYFAFRNRFRGGFNTYRVLEVRTVDIKGSKSQRPVFLPNGYPTDQTIYSYVEGTITARYVYLERNPQASLPMPIRPHVKMDLGSKQLIDTAALLRQIFSKR